jgi:hypothetical protein
MARKDWKQVLFVFFVVTLLLTACGSSEDEGVESGPSTVDGVVIISSSGGEVSSPDNSIKIEIPPGSFEGELEVTLQRVNPEDYPPELEGLEILGDLFELGPDGTTFDDPITIVRRFGASELGVDLTEGLPLIMLLSRDNNGEWSLLEEGFVTEENGQVVVTATTTHFSHTAAATTVHFMGHDVPVQLDPPTVQKPKGSSKLVKIKVGENDEFQSNLTDDTAWRTSAPEILHATNIANYSTLTCREVGNSDYFADLEFTWDDNSTEGLRRLFKELTGPEANIYKTTLQGKAQCTALNLAPVQNALVDQSLSIRIHFNESDGSCYQNFSDNYTGRFYHQEGVFSLELRQISTGQIVSGPFNAANFTFNELVDTQEIYRNGTWIIDPTTGRLVQIADYEHPCPDGSVNRWTTEADLTDFMEKVIARRTEELASSDEALPEGACEEGPKTLCLQEGRFAFEVFSTLDQVFDPQVITDIFPLERDNFGRFQDPSNPDLRMDIRLFNACETTGSFWLFAMPPVGFESVLTATDTRTGQFEVYYTGEDVGLNPITDTTGFSTCP